MTRKDYHQSSLHLCLLGNCDVFLFKKKCRRLQIRIDLTMLNVEIVNSTTQTSWFYLLKTPASDGFILAAITLNYAAAECDVYKRTLALQRRLEPRSVLFKVPYTKPLYRLPLWRGQRLFCWGFFSPGFLEGTQVSSRWQEDETQRQPGESLEGEPGAAALKCWAGPRWIKGRRPPPYALHCDA